MSAPLFALTFVTALGCALCAGAFFAFSSFVMAGLNRLPAPTAVASMQAINVAAPTPLFMTALFGTGPLCLAVAVASLVDFDGARSWLALAGAVVYVVGTPWVTMRFNVPLNNGLDAVDADGPGAADGWQRYFGPWLAWNHVRTVTGLVATGAMIASLAS